MTAIAVAMWNEIRADRTLVETMAEIPPRRPGRCHGTDLHEPAHARSLGTALRYMTAAGMATQRAQRAFLAHRKAKQAGLVLSAAEPAEAVNENCTNELQKLRHPMPRRNARTNSPQRKEPAAPTQGGKRDLGVRGPARGHSDQSPPAPPP